jgi:hypothetical protein
MSPNKERFQPPKLLERHRHRDRHIDADHANHPAGLSANLTETAPLKSP